MIRLISGLPGSGKSLRAVDYIVKARSEGRPVYVHGLNGLRDDLAEPCDPNEWETLPDGSIVIIDEAQKVWGQRRSGDVPPHIRKLSEHRHRGFDFVLITQHPTMLDTYVRKLIGEHSHLIRQFGMQAAKVITWGECYEDPQSLATRQRGTESLWRYPKECYELYKSATMHTVKKRIPFRLAIIPVFVILAAVLGWFALGSMGDLVGTDVSPDAIPAALASVGPASAGVRRDGVKYADALEYVQAHVPRVDGMPWSAEVFDGRGTRTEPDIMCVISEAKGCRCYTEQMTRVRLGIYRCNSIAKDGIYNPYRRPLGDRPSREREERG